MPDALIKSVLACTLPEPESTETSELLRKVSHKP